jgi:signal transduction histidine kinase
MTVTTRQAREELRRQERPSSIGISESIMHDLRNPLAAIHSAAEMLTEADLSPAHAKRLARNILSASRRTQALLQDLLNLSRGESSAPQSSSLREVAEAACELLSSTAESYGSTLIVESNRRSNSPWCGAGWSGSS